MRGQQDAQALHQGIGERGEHQAQPVGEELVATGAGKSRLVTTNRGLVPWLPNSRRVTTRCSMFQESAA